MAITAKQLTNRVLRALREEPISDNATELTDDYQILIWQFVNKARQEVEQAHKWRALRQTLNVTLAGGTSSVDLSGTNEHSLLMYDGCGGPMVFDVTDNKNVFQLREAPLSRILYWHMIDQGEQNEQPIWCSIDSDNDNLILRVWPTPRGARDITLEVYVPQGELDHTSSDDLDTNILVPARPVELLALAYALEERGEELGVDGQLAFQRAATALNEAIAQDYQAQATMNGPGQYDLQVL